MPICIYILNGEMMLLILLHGLCEPQLFRIQVSASDNASKVKETGLSCLPHYGAGNLLPS